MHNGLSPEIRGVLNMYNAGMPNQKPNAQQEKDPLFPKKSVLLPQLNLSEVELQAFQAS